MASITQRGDSFFAQVRIKRQGQIVFSESRSFPTRPMAESWAQRLEEKIKQEGTVAVAQRDLTVGKLIEKHLEYQQSLRPLGRSTIYNHEQAIAAWSSVKVLDLTAKHVIDYAIKRKAEGAGPATIMSNLSPVSAALHAAPYAHGIRVDPGEFDLAIKRLVEDGVAGKSKEVIRLVTPEEEKALLEEFERRNLHHQTTINMVHVYKMAIAFPRRASELTRITWSDIDHARNTILIRDVKHPKRKIGNNQTVPLLKPVQELLEQIPKLDDRIFPCNTETMLAAFERTRDRIAQTGLPSIKDLRFHDLRHTGITKLFWAGLQIQEVALISGHTNWVQLKRYTHIRPEDLHRRWEALNPTPQQPVAT